VFWTALKDLISFSLAHEVGSYIFVVIPVSAYLMYVKQRQIFRDVKAAPFSGAVLFLTATGLWVLCKTYEHPYIEDNQLSLIILTLVLFWISGFIFFYGTQAFLKGRFPLLFLFFLVPIPALAIEKITIFLQTGSATASYALLKLFSVPVLRDGFILQMPNLNIEVAKQCSGIRSSLILFITTLLVGEFALNSVWKKLFLVLCVVPILIFKNAARIVTLSLLSIYVDRGFLHGRLHSSGGIVFYVLGLLMLVPLVMVLRKMERGKSPLSALQARNEHEVATIRSGIM
jgi:exosortase